jgi:uncharacterized protein
MVFSYLGTRLGSNPFQLAAIIVVGILIWSLPIVHWSSPRTEEASPFRRFMQQSSYFAMALASWLFVLTFGSDLSFLTAYFVASPEGALKVQDVLNPLVIFVSAILITLLGAWRAFGDPRVKNIKIDLKDLPQSLHGFRIVQISDLHIGPTMGRKYVEKVISIVDSLNPDITVLTGDIIDGRFSDIRHSVEPLAKLFGGKNAYFALGNHEYYSRLDHWLPELSRLGINVMMNRGEMIIHKETKVWIGAVTDPAALQFRTDPPNAKKALAGGEEAHLKVLLSHRPGLAAEAHEAGFHLQLSGHTHGGQFFPWTYVAKLFHKYFVGLMKHEDMWIYVSPGTGTWGPPARIGTTPEVTCLVLSNSAT